MLDVTDKKIKIEILNKRKSWIILVILQSALTVVFSGWAVLLDVLPIKYLAPIIVILLAIEAYIFYVLLIQKEKTKILFSILVCTVLILGCYYLFETQSMLSAITNGNIKIDNMSVIVLKENLATNIDDAMNYMFGIQEKIDRENEDKTIQLINGELAAEIATAEFQDFDLQVEALYRGEINAIILNEAYREIITDVYQDFNQKTRILSDYQIRSKVDLETGQKKLDQDSFVVYISGIDCYGPISATSRSDVNIIATINPKTKQILLTTTPRDYYVVLPVSNRQKDKLTHAGIYGIDVSIGTLEDLYDINIDYYVRVNFTSLVDTIDVLGDITVNSDFAFVAGSTRFNKGYNQLNGEAALAFSRERHAFASGDNQRGKNQIKVLTAIINKAVSPTIIMNYSGVMNSVSKSFETNMSSNEITSLVKMQMNDMASWNIVSSNVTGRGDSKTTYSYSSRALYVMIPDESTVAVAKEKMQQVIQGQVISK